MRSFMKHLPKGYSIPGRLKYGCFNYVHILVMAIYVVSSFPFDKMDS